MLEVRPCYNTISYYIDGLAQDCSNSSALAMELLQSCSKSSNIIVYSTTSAQVEQGGQSWTLTGHPISHTHEPAMGCLLKEYFGETSPCYDGNVPYFGQLYVLSYDWET